MLQFRKLFSRNLDIHLRSRDGLTIRIIERPGITLRGSQLAQLVQDLRVVAQAAIPKGNLNYGVFDAGGERLKHSVVTIVYRGNVPIAFNALAILNIQLRGYSEDVVHLGLVLIDPSQRSKGLSWILYGLTCIVIFLRNQMRPLWISNVTQVPAIVGMVAETFSGVFPTVGKKNQKSFAHVRVAREIMNHHRHAFGVGNDAFFDEDRFVIENAYTGGSDNLKKSFEQATKHRIQHYNDLCVQSLDYDRGDDFLQLGRINFSVVMQFISRNVPRNALIQVIGWFLAISCNGLLLPLVRWLSVHRRFGQLRARGYDSLGTAPPKATEIDIGSVYENLQKSPPPTTQKEYEKPVEEERVDLGFIEATKSINKETFSYDEMVMRNIGFVSPDEQNTLQHACVFVCGTGGMGGACLQALVRAGVTNFIIADIDTFEVSNLNRQVFASLSDVGAEKMSTTLRKLQNINPEVAIECYQGEWVDHLDEILQKTKLVINGMDDIAAGIHLYRQAAKSGATVIDAYASPLPSVTLVRPSDPRPEQRLKFGTLDTHWRELSKEQEDHCKFREMLFVFCNSSSVKHFHMEYAAEVFQGTRSRPSFAPMVITTGNLMAFEAIKTMFGRTDGTDYRGYFFNPWGKKVEFPRKGKLSAAIVEWYAQKQLAKMLSEGGSEHAS